MRSGKRGLVLSLVVAVAVVFGAELVVRAAASRLPEPLVWNDREVQNKVARMEALGRNVPGASAVFVGSSSMNAAADPILTDRLIGAKTRPSFNAALNGADLRSLEIWVTRVVLPKLRPQVIVLGTTSLELNDNGITQADFFRKFTRSEGARRVRGGLGPRTRVEAWAEDNSYLARYRTELRRPGTILKGDAQADRARVGSQGILASIPQFHSRPYAIPAEFRRRTEQESYHDYTVGGSQLQALERLADTLESRGVSLIFVKLPVTKDLIPMHPRGRTDYARYERTVEGFAEDHEVGVVDASAHIGDAGDFVDPIHLNANGMRTFTQLIAPTIRREAG
ncbi:MAG: hypothetical protein ACRDKJ_05755 [Actinomycetota bacterium]